VVPDLGGPEEIVRSKDRACAGEVASSDREPRLRRFRTSTDARGHLVDESVDRDPPGPCSRRPEEHLGNGAAATRASSNRERVLIPAPPSLRGLAKAPRIRLTAELLQQENAESADYGELIEDILACWMAATDRATASTLTRCPGHGRRRTLDPRQQRGRERRGGRTPGHRFAASYHISPATALEAAEGYRKAFVPHGISIVPIWRSPPTSW